MSKLSQAKVKSGWKPPVSVELRDGQTRLYEFIKNNRQDKYSIQLPTGYGKSWCACIAYATLKSLGIVDRCLIVVPTDQQRSQYVSGLPEDLAILRIDYRGIERCDNQSAWVIKQSIRNKSDIFVAGIGSIVANPGYYTDLMEKGRWLVVADEFHHYGESNTWGKAVLGLSREVILGMSATPFRGDKTQTIFGDDEFDVRVTLAEASREKAIRPVKAEIHDYYVTWSSIDNPDPQNSKMSELSIDWGSDISEFELKKGVRYHDKYVSDIFGRVLTAWLEYEEKFPQQNQILVFAMSCAHAELITKVINDLTMYMVDYKFADWIGVGEGKTQKRSDKENQQILDAFQRNELKCLVQVNKAGEGFNNKRCSIGLFLDLIGDTPQKRQHIGRFMRVNPDAPGQSSLIFISEDSPCRSLLENMRDELNQGLDSNESSGSGGSQGRQLTIPDIYIIDTSYHSSRSVYPFGSEQALQAKIEQYDEKMKSGPAAEAYLSMDEGQRIALVKEGLIQLWEDEQMAKNPPLTSEQRRKQITTKISYNLTTLVKHVARIRYGRSMPKSVDGDLYRLVNSQWKKINGGEGHSSMGEEELLRKNKWLQELAEQINKHGIPTWLSI